MTTKTVKGNLLLLLTAFIWGFAFVAQSVGMKYLQPFTFNGIRFLLGGISLIPVLLFFDRKKSNLKIAIYGGIISGIVTFLGSSFQQIGIVGTTVGKAGFITGLYIVFVPILGMFLKQKIGLNAWIGAAFALVGLYFLCDISSLSMSFSDLLELLGAVFFAIQIHVIDYFSGKTSSLKLAFFQFITCAVLSMTVALFTEKIYISSIYNCAVPILYGGICSVGIAYTFQIIGQKNAKPSHAAIIMSMESVFGAIGGVIILHERMSFQFLIGCVLMLMGMLISQVSSFKNKVVEQ
jgi:drug/metabolite transporter (DMT)-like permease